MKLTGATVAFTMWLSCGGWLSARAEDTRFYDKLICSGSCMGKPTLPPLDSGAETAGAVFGMIEKVGLVVLKKISPLLPVLYESILGLLPQPNEGIKIERLRTDLTQLVASSVEQVRIDGQISDFAGFATNARHWLGRAIEEDVAHRNNELTNGESFCIEFHNALGSTLYENRAKLALLPEYCSTCSAVFSTRIQYEKLHGNLHGRDQMENLVWLARDCAQVGPALVPGAIEERLKALKVYTADTVASGSAGGRCNVNLYSKGSWNYDAWDGDKMLLQWHSLGKCDLDFVVWGQEVECPHQREYAFSCVTDYITELRRQQEYLYLERVLGPGESWAAELAHLQKVYASELSSDELGNPSAADLAKASPTNLNTLTISGADTLCDLQLLGPDDNEVPLLDWIHGGDRDDQGCLELGGATYTAYFAKSMIVTQMVLQQQGLHTLSGATTHINGGLVSFLHGSGTIRAFHRVNIYREGTAAERATNGGASVLTAGAGTNPDVHVSPWTKPIRFEVRSDWASEHGVTKLRDRDSLNWLTLTRKHPNADDRFILAAGNSGEPGHQDFEFVSLGAGLWKIRAPKVGNLTMITQAAFDEVVVPSWRWGGWVADESTYQFRLDYHYLEAPVAVGVATGRIEVQLPPRVDKAGQVLTVCSLSVESSSGEAVALAADTEGQAKALSSDAAECFVSPSEEAPRLLVRYDKTRFPMLYDLNVVGSGGAGLNGALVYVDGRLASKTYRASATLVYRLRVPSTGKVLTEGTTKVEARYTASGGVVFAVFRSGGGSRFRVSGDGTMLGFAEDVNAQGANIGSISLDGQEIEVQARPNGRVALKDAHSHRYLSMEGDTLTSVAVDLLKQPLREAQEFVAELVHGNMLGLHGLLGAVDDLNVLEIRTRGGKFLTLCEVEAFGMNNARIPLSGAVQSTTGWGGEAVRAVDGNDAQGVWESNSCTHTGFQQPGQVHFWRATFPRGVARGNVHEVARIVITGRNILQGRLDGASVLLNGDTVGVLQGAKLTYTVNVEYALRREKDVEGETIDVHPFFYNLPYAAATGSVGPGAPFNFGTASAGGDLVHMLTREGQPLSISENWYTMGVTQWMKTPVAIQMEMVGRSAGYAVYALRQQNNLYVSAPSFDYMRPMAGDGATGHWVLVPFAALG